MPVYRPYTPVSYRNLQNQVQSATVGPSAESSTSKGTQTAGQAADCSPCQLPPNQKVKLVPAVADVDTNRYWLLHRPHAKKRLDTLGDKRFADAFRICVQPLSDAFSRTHGLRLSEALKRHEEPKDLKKADGARKHLTEKIARQFARKQEEMLAERGVMTVWGNRMSLRRYASGRMANYFEVCPPPAAQHNATRAVSLAHLIGLGQQPRPTNYPIPQSYPTPITFNFRDSTSEFQGQLGCSITVEPLRIQHNIVRVLTEER